MRTKWHHPHFWMMKLGLRKVQESVLESGGQRQHLSQVGPRVEPFPPHLTAALMLICVLSKEAKQSLVRGGHRKILFCSSSSFQVLYLNNLISKLEFILFILCINMCMSLSVCSIYICLCLNQRQVLYTLIKANSHISNYILPGISLQNWKFCSLSILTTRLNIYISHLNSNKSINNLSRGKFNKFWLTCWKFIDVNPRFFWLETKLKSLEPFSSLTALKNWLGEIWGDKNNSNKSHSVPGTLLQSLCFNQSENWYWLKALRVSRMGCQGWDQCFFLFWRKRTARNRIGRFLAERN